MPLRSIGAALRGTLTSKIHLQQAAVGKRSPIWYPRSHHYAGGALWPVSSTSTLRPWLLRTRMTRAMVDLGAAPQGTSRMGPRGRVSRLPQEAKQVPLAGTGSGPGSVGIYARPRCGTWWVPAQTGRRSRLRSVDQPTLRKRPGVYARKLSVSLRAPTFRRRAWPRAGSRKVTTPWAAGCSRARRRKS